MSSSNASRPTIDGEYLLVFDGGSLGNPGRGYGSFYLAGPDLPGRVERLEFGDRVTNNEAEYRALIGGLEAFAKFLETSGRPPGAIRVTIRGDSQLVISQVMGLWKVRNEKLRPLHRRAKELVDLFDHAVLQWQPRSASYAVLGH